MKTALIVILGGLVIAAVLVFVGNAYIKYSLRAMHRRETLAENVRVNSDWQEIRFEEPLKGEKQVQKVMLSIDGYEHNLHDNDFGKIRLTDGTFVNPEIQIVDENDKIYQLRDGTRLGNSVGFSPDQEIHGTYEFPRDVAYKSVKIRSDKPFQCSRIYWYDHDLK